MIAYKGFTSDLTARMGRGTYQFEVGRKEITKEANCASNGFHCAENPLDVLNYYSLPTDRFFIVKAEGDIHEDACGSRISCTELTPVKEISREGLALHGCDYMLKHPDREWNSRVSKEEGSSDDYFAIVRGKHPKAKGEKGTTLFLLQEAEESNEIINITVHKVDGKFIKAGKYYNVEGMVPDDKE